MSFLGLTPSEYSSGGIIRRGGITRTGNREARRMLIEAAWSYRFPAKVAQHKARVPETRPNCVRDHARRAQERLRKRYRTLQAGGKKPTIIAAATTRDPAGSSGLRNRRCGPGSTGAAGQAEAHEAALMVGDVPGGTGRAGPETPPVPAGDQAPR